jgi:hypothetical protein
MKTYVIDLDHTLCNTTKNENGYWNYLDATPYQDRIAKINQLYLNGNVIIIETARGCNSGKNWYEETRKQLISWGLKFHKLRTGIKFGADYYIDDKAVNSEDFFNGKFTISN